MAQIRPARLRDVTALMDDNPTPTGFLAGLVADAFFYVSDRLRRQVRTGRARRVAATTGIPSVLLGKQCFEAHYIREFMKIFDLSLAAMPGIERKT